MPKRSSKWLWPLFLPVATAACGTSGSGLGFASSTFIEVSPEEFQGVKCETEQGQLKRYVATLVDVTDNEPFELPSSPPVPCNVAVRFSNVVAGTHSYIARLDGYDETDLTPAAPGSPILQRDGEYVQPRWQGSCGRSAPSAVARTPRDAGPPAADAGLPIDAGDPLAAKADAGAFFEAFLGPVEPLPGRTVRLRGCWLVERSFVGSNR